MKYNIKKFVVKHLDEAGENYFQHLLFTLKMFFQTIFAALILLIHGFLPFIFTRTASKRFEKIDNIFQERVRKLDQDKLSGLK
jgi:hypothetical protein